MKHNKICKFPDIEYNLRNYSIDARNLVRLLLSVDPSKRPTASQALRHPWFSNEKAILKGSVRLNRVLATV